MRIFSESKNVIIKLVSEMLAEIENLRKSREKPFEKKASHF